MFASLFKRAEASVDNAIGDLGNRVLIALPFLVAIGFAAASLSMIANRAYGAEIGNFLLAAGFLALGCIVAIVVKIRQENATPVDAPQATADEEQLGSAKSIFDNEQLLGVVSAAAPILLPALLRTATKNWPLILAVAGGLYVFSLSDGSDSAQTPTPQT